jgi:hypothetical protein
LASSRLVKGKFRAIISTENKSYIFKNTHRKINILGLELVSKIAPTVSKEILKLFSIRVDLRNIEGVLYVIGQYLHIALATKSRDSATAGKISKQ